VNYQRARSVEGLTLMFLLGQRIDNEGKQDETLPFNNEQVFSSL
jgi:hypothetical protein